MRALDPLVSALRKVLVWYAAGRLERRLRERRSTERNYMPRAILASAGILVLMACAANASAKMQITSTAFANGASIPSKYTCDASMPPNPPLAFRGVPAKAQSLVLIVEDPDVPKSLMPSGVFDHWMVWDISASSKGIKEGDSERGINGTGKSGYVGPCPPDREHRYFFHLYALDTKLGNANFANRKQLEDAMKGHVIEQAELMGRYKKVKK
jgi:Raf kinase inhibitor-like YbhB/YbcL family protein